MRTLGRLSIVACGLAVGGCAPRAVEPLVPAELRGLQAFSQRDDSLALGRRKPAWLAKRFGIPAERLASHRDYARTDCPGEHLYARLPRLRELVAAARY
jgi:hypothetical protein